jgi:hypothetical protein
VLRIVVLGICPMIDRGKEYGGITRSAIMKQTKLTSVVSGFDQWKSGIDGIDKLVLDLISHDKDKREDSRPKIVEIGEPIVPMLLNALILINTDPRHGFSLLGGHSTERNYELLMTIGDIGSPKAFPVLHKIYKQWEKTGTISRCEEMGYRSVAWLLYRALQYALDKCDHRWWKKLLRRSQSSSTPT